MPLSLTRTHNLWDQQIYVLGKGTNHPYDVAPTGSRFPYTFLDIHLEDGNSVHFDRVSKGTGFADAALTGVFFGDETLHAQNDPGKGWVEGAIVTEKGKPACGASSNLGYNFCAGATITLRPKEGNGTKTDSDTSKAGF